MKVPKIHRVKIINISFSYTIYFFMECSSLKTTPLDESTYVQRETKNILVSNVIQFICYLSFLNTYDIL